MSRAYFRTKHCVLLFLLSSLLTIASSDAYCVEYRPNCVYNDDCAPGLICEGQMCRFPCRSSVDCDDDEVCLLNTQPRGVPTSYVRAFSACIKRSLYSVSIGLPLEEIPMQRTNIYGHDIGVMAISDNDPMTCYYRCKTLPRCNAWSFVRSGIQGVAPYCWFKSVPTLPGPRVEDPNCVSGVISFPVAVPVR